MDNWSERTDRNTVERRATGRRRWQHRQRLRMLARRRQVAWLIAQGALEEWGAQSEIARQLGVDRRTISGDVAAILAAARAEAGLG